MAGENFAKGPTKPAESAVPCMNWFPTKTYRIAHIATNILHLKHMEFVVDASDDTILTFHEIMILSEF